MKRGKATKFFAGGNTAYGFVSLFDYIPPREGADRFLIIKGGPGTGKSTLMKKIGERVMELGFDAEFFYCSSDNESLDGLSVPSLGFVMVDGTAPHVIDPWVPGGRDEIINLGECWDKWQLRRHREDIAALIRENSTCFTQAYHYLREAAVVMDQARSLMAGAMDFNGVNSMTCRLLCEIAAALPPSGRAPYERRLFAGAITPQGTVNFYPSIVRDVSTFYLLSGDAGSGKSFLLRQVRDMVLRHGHDVHVYHCAFDPERIDALVVPVIKTAFVKATYPHSFAIDPTQAVTRQVPITLSRHTRAAVLKKTVQERSESMERFWYLLGKATEMIRKAKRIHDRLEEFYIKAMDFDLVGEIQEKITKDVLASAVSQ